jgi:hypothetical protein
MFMTKIFTRFFLLIALLTLVSCDKADKYTQFYLDYNSQVSIPPISLLGVPLIEINDLTTAQTATNTTQYFQTYNTRADLIDKITLDQITLTFTQPQYANFDCMKSIKVFIAAENLAELKIAEYEDIPLGLTILPLDIVDNNLIEYIKSETYTLRVVVEFRSSTRGERVLNIASRFFVDAKILGI